jgi:DNA-binding MarR family transcriptional regulator
MSYITQAELTVLRQFYRHQCNGDFLPPCIRCLCSELNRSTATIQQHINRLYGNGYLKKRVEGRRIARNYFLSEKGLTLLTQSMMEKAAGTSGGETETTKAKGK